jgi:hypothetical protein
MTVTGLLPDVVVRLHGPDALKTTVADAVSGVSTVRLSRATAALIGVFVMRKLPIKNELHSTLLLTLDWIRSL